MGSDTTVVYTSPSTNVKVYRETTGSADAQYVRPHSAVTMTADAWTVTTTGVASRAAADTTRVSLSFSNTGTAICYVRPDSTIPTGTTFYVQLAPGETFEAKDVMAQLAWSVAANSSAGGTLTIWKGTTG